MKRETVFGILGVLLYTQPSVAQKSVTDTVRLNFNIDSADFSWFVFCNIWKK